MEAGGKKQWLRAVGTMIATVVGVGVFGLPSVFSRAGFLLGLAELVALTAVLVILTLMYAELTMDTPGRHRFVTYIGRYLGPFGKWLAQVTFVGSVFGASLAFTIIGGDFLSRLSVGRLAPAVASIVVWLIVGALAFGGFKAVSRLVVWIILSLLVLYAILISSALPAFQLPNLLAVSSDPLAFFIPYGVIIFSLTGMGAIPEMHDLFGRHKRRLPQAILAAYAVIFLLYAVFIASVIGAAGPLTSPDVLVSLAPYVSHVVLTLGAVLGTISVISIFTMLGAETVNLFQIDFGMSRRSAWLLTFGIPLIMFLLGMRQFIPVIGFVGGLFSGLIGILIILAYERLKKTTTKKNIRRLPSIVSFGIGLVLAIGMTLQIVYTFN
ncbi:MAG: aromatic amino acid transport family protein [Patescibacteria group bacterium]